MDRRLLCWTALIAAAATLLGLGFLDRPIAEWVHASGFEQAAFFSLGLATLDIGSGLRFWIWLAGFALLFIGVIGVALVRHARWSRVCVIAAIVQLACVATMIVMKDGFGRLRPQQLLESGDWSHMWFAGGASFPSGHSAFYFGLCLPFAAACPIRWLRVVLFAIPVYVVLARIDLARHFLSDVSASALMAALYALLVARLARRWLPVAMQAPLASAL
ncbi:MAG: phosphatase PAP2 family protein [Lysobacterales bacterium]